MVHVCETILQQVKALLLDQVMAPACHLQSLRLTKGGPQCQCQTGSGPADLCVLGRESIRGQQEQHNDWISVVFFFPASLISWTSHSFAELHASSDRQQLFVLGPRLGNSETQAILGCRHSNFHELLLVLKSKGCFTSGALICLGSFIFSKGAFRSYSCECVMSCF